MKCTKCGSDAVMKDGDWLTCLNCGNVMFDTRRPEETAAEISPTKLLEQMEAAAAQEEAPPLRRTRPEKKRKSRRKAKAAADKAEEKNPVKDIVDFMLPIVIAVILALLLTNTTMSVIAALGAVMLVGIVTKNGIVLIDFINLMRERGIRLYDAIAQACRSRLRPVLMTALTTILGMLPMALSTGEGSETWRPMGVAVIGGLVFSTIITMIIVPVIYAAMDKSGSRDKKKALSKQFKFMRDFDPKELEQK